MAQSPLPKPGSWSRIRALTAGAVPVVAWLGMIALALFLHQRRGTQPAVVGYAEDRPVTLAHLQPGAVRSLHVSLHEHVHPGQVVLTMDDGSERAQLAVIKKDIERLASEVAAEEARLRMAEAERQLDEEDLSRRFLVDRESAHIEYLAAVVADARDRILLRGAQVEYDILKDLHEQGNAPFRELNDQQTEVDALAKQIEENKALIERTKQAFDESDRRWFAHRDAQTEPVPHDAVLTPLRLAVEVRRRELDELVDQIDSQVLRAPIPGQVVALFAHAGDRVQAGSPLVQISPSETDRAILYLPERQAGLAAVGMPVQVERVASLAGTRALLTGHVESVAAIIGEVPIRHRVDPNRPEWARAVVIAVDEDVTLMPGEQVSVSLRP